MQFAKLAPVGPPVTANRRWTIAASAALHAAFFALLLGITARHAPPEPGGSPSYDLVFEDGSAGQPGTPQQALPPAQPAEIPAPDDAPPGLPAPEPASPPAPDGMPSPLPESAMLAPAPLTAPEVPPPASAAPAPTAPPSPAAQPELAFAPPLPEAEVPPPEPVEVLPEPVPPAVRLEQPPASRPPQETAPILPQPPPPLPPMPPRARAVPRAAPGTLSNPMDLSFAPGAPAPRQAARGSVASRAIDLSPGPPRQGPLRSDPYAKIRAANASEDWNRGLLSYWLRHRYYPQQAAENGEEGTVVIELTVNRSGRVESVDIKSRSGSQWLDMAAVGTFRGAQLPPFSPEMTEDRITFPIPITYYLIRR